MDSVEYLDRLIRHYEEQQGMYSENLAEWQKKCNMDAAHAFEWSLHAFADAARTAVGKEILSALKGGVATRKTILKHARAQVLTGALYPPHSTSPTSNILTQYKTAAWADAVEIFSGETLRSI